MTIRPALIPFMILVTVLNGITRAWAKPPDLRVAAAANLRAVLPGWVNEFSARTKTRVEVIYGSSGGLATQIKHGAPFDVFLSVNVNFADSLFVWGQADSSPQVYAKGLLALWSPLGKTVDSQLRCLRDGSGLTLILADTSHSPYGQMAYQALVSGGVFSADPQKDGGYGKGAPNPNRNRVNLVFGENLSQVMQFAQGGHAEMALVSMSLLVDAERPPKGRWVKVDSTLAPPIPQALVVTRHGEAHARETSQAWVAFLLSPERDEAWRKAGYLPASRPQKGGNVHE